MSVPSNLSSAQPKLNREVWVVLVSAMV